VNDRRSKSVGAKTTSTTVAGPGQLTAETRHIAIVGMMAVGKTTVGRLLGAQIKRQFIDLDQVIVEQQKMTVAEMFAMHGEAWFRDVETATLAATLARDTPLVISLGGGAVTTAGSRLLLAENCFVVWLRASPATVLARIGDPSSRPLLAKDPEGAVKSLDAARRDVYASVAHYALSVDRRTPRWVASCIARRVSGQPSPSRPDPKNLSEKSAKAGKVGSS
jgi:shikimate kinase